MREKGDDAHTRRGRASLLLLLLPSPFVRVRPTVREERGGGGKKSIDVFPLALLSLLLQAPPMDLEDSARSITCTTSLQPSSFPPYQHSREREKATRERVGGLVCIKHSIFVLCLLYCALAVALGNDENDDDNNTHTIPLFDSSPTSSSSSSSSHSAAAACVLLWQQQLSK